MMHNRGGEKKKVGVMTPQPRGGLLPNNYRTTGTTTVIDNYDLTMNDA